MSWEGTIINGQIVLDAPTNLPDGTRVRVEPAAEDEDLWAELANVPPPPAMETREEFLESLRQSIAEVKAGVPGLTVDEAFARVDADLRRLAEEGKT